MSVLANNRRELFAQLLFQGFTAVDAYQKAGYRRHDRNACTLAKNPQVQARLEEIRDELAAATGLPVGTNAIAAKTKVTAESLIDEAEEVRVGAMDSHQYAAANTAIKQKGVLGGVWIEKSEIGAPGEFDHISDDDVERAIIERFTRLFGPKLAIKDGSITVNGGSDDESF